GGWRHAFPGRDRYAHAATADKATARAGGPSGAAAWRTDAAEDRFPADLRDERASGGDGSHGTVPRGSLLQDSRGADPSASAPRAGRGHSAALRVLSADTLRREWSAGEETC